MLPFIYYESLLLFFHQIKQRTCSGKELMEVIEFAEGLYGSTLYVNHFLSVKKNLKSS